MAGQSKSQSAGRRSRRGYSHKRRSVPWAGWGKLAPKGHQRTVMKRDCGRKCFLGPKKSFPICAKGTCKVNKKGLWAAYIRAKEWGNKRSSYKGKARPTHRRSVYTRVARDAKKMLERRGSRVGRGGSSCGSSRKKKGGMKKCAKGYTRKLVGQRRNSRGRIVRHGHYSRKCTRKH